MMMLLFIIIVIGGVFTIIGAVALCARCRSILKQRYNQYYLGFNLPSVMLAKRTDNFEEKLKKK